MGLGAVVITLAIAGVLAWMAYLVISSRTGPPKPEETPKNLQPYLSDDDLESNRLTRVLGAAVVVAAVLALSLPVYFLNEPNRQEEAREAFHERDVEEGEHWYEHFSCVNCHGPEAVGGGAAFIEPRSGLNTSWSAPSLNDVFYRYSEDEVRFWIVYGRQGSPMPASGLEGGGAMTDQEIDQVIAYLQSLQLPQSEVLGNVDGRVTQALSRIESGATIVRELLAEQDAEIAAIETAPDTYDQIAEFPATIGAALGDPGVCTRRSAALVDRSCSDAGLDSDRDGLSDAAEAALSRLAADAASILGDETLRLDLDPATAFSTTDAAGEPVADLDAADSLLTTMNARELNLRVTSERQDVFLGNAEAGRDFLTEALAAEAWRIDFDAIAAAGFGGDTEAARRGAGLYNAYCARCHTAGYSAGVAYEKGAGSGAWGPALADGRTVIQFPDAADHIDFIIGGSELGRSYGVNGIGRGWMPGFGQSLSLEDIELIVEFERSL